MYKLLIIDDEPLVQAGIRSMLSWEELGISVCGIAANGQAGWELMELEQPDIIITDVKMCLDVTDDTRIITYIPNLHVSTRFLM